MEKKRLFYLDFIRAVATVAILLTHFNAIFAYTTPQMLEKSVVTFYVANIYIGNFGVALFLIISGASLMYVYREKLEPGAFYKKRVVRIYPMFWMAYAAAYIIRTIRLGAVNEGVPRSRILWSILGMDAYFSGYLGMDTLYIVGEWFLGFIILFYLIFPLLRKIMISSPVWFGIFTAGCFTLSWFVPHGRLSVIRLLPLIAFGMYYVRYVKKTNWKMALAALSVLIVNQIFKPTHALIPEDVQELYVGIACFLVLTFLADFITWKPVRRLCGWICKYSYPIFIVHHTIILLIMSRVDLVAMSKAKSYLMFGICCLAIFPAAIMLQAVHDYVMGLILRMKSKKTDACRRG